MRRRHGEVVTQQFALESGFALFAVALACDTTDIDELAAVADVDGMLNQRDHSSGVIGNHSGDRQFRHIMADQRERNPRVKHIAQQRDRRGVGNAQYARHRVVIERDRLRVGGVFGVGIDHDFVAACFRDFLNAH